MKRGRLGLTGPVGRLPRPPRVDASLLIPPPRLVTQLREGVVGDTCLWRPALRPVLGPRHGVHIGADRDTATARLRLLGTPEGVPRAPRPPRPTPLAPLVMSVGNVRERLLLQRGAAPRPPTTLRVVKAAGTRPPTRILAPRPPSGDSALDGV